MSLMDDAKAAREAGMTYGQYMTLRPFHPYKKTIGPKCINCGCALIGKQSRFCSRECRDQMRAKTARGDVFV